MARRYALILVGIIALLFYPALVSASDVSVWQGQYYTGTTFNVGTYTFAFKIYDAPTGGNICFSHTETITTGNFGEWKTEQSGVNTACGDASKDYWLNININGADQLPRRRVLMWDFLRKGVNETGSLLTGITGITGPQGPQGIQGATGPQGAQGVQGIQGAQGDKGADGTSVTILGSYDTFDDLNASHPTGSSGDSYLVSGNLYIWDGSAWKNVGNIQGPQGLKGDAGAQGPEGAQGLQGIQGTTGATGAQGPKGDTGAQGLQGLQGPEGPAGANGAQGLQGPEGPAGANGSQGPQGIQGPAGLNGSQGIQGPQGVAGVNGTNGINGINGSQGPAGVNGTNGINGTNAYNIIVYQMNYANVTMLNQSNDFGANNLTTTGTGFFAYLGSILSRITKLWAQDIDVSNNINVTNNVTAAYFIGNGSRLTGVLTSSPVSQYVTQADYQTANYTNFNQTILTIPVSANANYTVECVFFAVSSAADRGVQLNISVPSSPNLFNGAWNAPTAADTDFYVYCQGSTTSCAEMQTSASATGLPIYFDGRLENINSGNIVVALKEESSGGTATIKRGSYCKLMSGA